MENNGNKGVFIESLTEFMSDEAGLSDEDIASELRELGIDPEGLEKKVEEIVAKASEQRRLAWREKAKQRRAEIDKMLGQGQQRSPSSADLKTKIREILEGSFGKGARSFAEAYFRKKERVSEGDLASLLDDLEKLGLLEESNKDKE